MRPYKARYVAACQQLLTLAAVLAALTPATAVISMEVVEQQPATQQATVEGRTSPAATGALRPQHTQQASSPVRPATGGTATTRQASADDTGGEPSRVPAQAVEPTVTEVPLTPPAGAPASGSDTREEPETEAPGTAPEPAPESDEGPSGNAVTRRTAAGETLVSQPQPVTGYGAVGITWSSDQQVPEEGITFQLRSERAGGWSDWAPIEYHDTEAPDPGSPDARGQRGGTSATIVGDVDQVQVRVISQRPLPADMELAVVDPGEATGDTVEEPAIDTGQGALGPGDGIEDGTTLPSDDGEIALQATRFTTRPRIFSRAQWGADESMRDPGSLHYYEVHAGFVHHTVTSNDYTRAQVPAIIRSIYAYHTRSRGWSDIGYNFLVDRFGRIWEGRYGGVDRPVVGAHTLGYNDYAFAASALGNYDIKRPSDAMIKAYGRLFAWKLALHGVDASSTSQRVGPDTFRAISGHRDAGSTACPGRYLYAKIPAIRGLATDIQVGWSGRELEDNIVGHAFPDLVGRRASDHRIVVVPTGGLLGFARAAETGKGFTDRTVVALPDVTGDGEGDLLVRRRDGDVAIRPGLGNGTYGPRVHSFRNWDKFDLILSVGDVNEDGQPDLAARRASDGQLAVWAGRGGGRFAWLATSRGWGGYDAVVGVGDLTQDGRADLLVRRSGALLLREGNGRGRFRSGVQVPGAFGRYDLLTGGGDLTKDGIPDVFARDRSSRKGWVLPGRANGTVGRAVGPVGGVGPLSTLTVGPSTGSADPDLVAVDGDRLVVRRHRGRYNLGRPVDTGLVVHNANRLMKVGDWDRDGQVDLMIRNSWGTLFLYRGRGNGTFEAAGRLAKGFGGVSLLASVGDVTGDGWPDLMGQPKSGSMRIYPGRGLNGFKRSYVAYSSISAAQQVGIGRWNGDGAPDSLFRSGSSLRYYPGNGPGGLTRGNRDLGIDLSPYDRVLGVSDVKRFGHADVIVRRRSSGELWLLSGRASGFAARRFLGEGAGGYDLLD